MTSVKTQLPYDYYSLPFCKPAKGIHYKSENLGHFDCMTLLYGIVRRSIRDSK